MPRIALVHDLLGGRAGGGGGARVVLDLALELHDRGHEIVVVCHDFMPTGDFEQLSRDFEVRAVRSGMAQLAGGHRGRFERYFRGMQRVAALVPDDVDVINAHDWPGLRAGRLAAERIGVPLLWTRNDDIEWERAVIPQMTASGAGRRSRLPAKLALGLLDVRDARRADTIIVLSNHDAAMVRRAYRREAVVIRPGPGKAFFETPPDRAAARRDLGVAEGDFLVLAFALLTPYRRFEDLIDASAMLHDLSDVRTRIVGSDHLNPAYGRQLDDRLRAKNLNGRIVLDRRSVSDRELRGLYAAADLYVFPSSRQSHGLAPLEALASGTPVVVSEGAGVHEVLRGRVGASIVPPANPDAIAAAIRAARAARDNGGIEPTRQWVRDELSAERHAITMERLIERALARAAADPSNLSRAPAVIS
jgi:glycosyltransferase involved in cell wall biosynthesis